MTSAPLRPCGPFCARHPLPEAGTRAPAAFSWAHNSLRNAQALCTPQRTAQNSAPAVVGPHPTVLPLRRFSGPTAAHLFIYSHHPLGIPLPHPCSCARACVRACVCVVAWWASVSAAQINWSRAWEGAGNWQHDRRGQWTDQVGRPPVA